MAGPRRINDAQVERLLQAMRQSPQYRAELARRLVIKEGLNPSARKGTKAYQNYQRRYKSTMRRFQRYVTTAGEKRSFAGAPIEYQREVRQEARRIELPGIISGPPRPPRDFELAPPLIEFEEAREITSYDLRAIIAYYDGDSEEAARAMNLSRRAYDLLDLSVRGLDVTSLDGSGELLDAARFLLKSLPALDVQDIEDFHDLLMNLPDWEISMILADLEDGYTSFADWMDLWRDIGLDYDTLLSDSDWWKLWRAAYGRSNA